MATNSSELKIEETAVARDAVLERGEKDTVAAVRAELGDRGSNTTISKHLTQLRAGWGSPSLFLSQFPQRLAELCREMGDMMEEQANQRTAHVSALLEDKRRNLEQQKNTLMHERDLAIATIEAEQSKNAELRLRLLEATENHNSAVAELNELRPLLAKADLKNEQLSERVLEASSKIDRLKQHITTYEGEVKIQRQAEANRHAGQLGALETNLSNSRGNELRLTEQLGDAKRQIDKLNAGQETAENRAVQAEKEVVKMHELVADLSIEQTKFVQREEELEMRLSTAVSDKEVAAQKLTGLQDQLIQAQSNLEKLRVSGAAESRSVITGIVEHSRRVFELASRAATKDDPELKELGHSQRDIERLFGTAD